MDLTRIMSIFPTFGLQHDDAFGTAVLLELLAFLTCMVFMVQILVGLISHQVSHAFVGLEVVEILLNLVKCLSFPFLILAGFICLGRTITIKIWVFLGVAIDLILAVLLSYLILSDERYETVSIVSLIIFQIASLFFRGYIYNCCWNAWSMIDKGLDLRGYGQGCLHLFLYYKDEFKRAACIIFVVELVWNFFATMALDLEIELIVQKKALEENGLLLPRPIIPLRVIRFIVSSIGLVLVKKEKFSYLKFGWFPCQIFSLIFGIVVLFLVVTQSTNPQIHVTTVGLFSMESTIHFVLNMSLIYFVLKFVSQRPISPRPLFPSSDTIN